jgi:hypothetical protein
MIDTEVVRLQRLRNTALRARAIAMALIAAPATHSSVMSHSAAACWRIARVITGTLRAHPYLGYQRGPSHVRGTYDRLTASVLGALARNRGRSLQLLSGELEHVVRELDDARALTLSTELSDTLGRSQAQIRGLIAEIDSGARSKSGARLTAARMDVRAGVVREDTGGVAANWPYLAF